MGDTLVILDLFICENKNVNINKKIRVIKILFTICVVKIYKKFKMQKLINIL